MATERAKRRRRRGAHAAAGETHRDSPQRRLTWLVWPGLVAAAAAGAFWLGKDQATGGGEAVRPPARGLPHTPDYHSLLVDPRDGDSLLLGTHVGVYASTNGGVSWRFAGLEGDDAMHLGRERDGTLWVAGHEVLARSEDGGRTWSDVHPDGLPSLDIHGFAVSPEEDRLHAAVAGEALFASADGGRSFERVSTEVGADVVALAAGAGERLLASERRGIMLSDDGGASWRPVLAQPAAALAVSRADPRRALASGAGLFLSVDGGSSWKRVAPRGEGFGPVAFARDDPGLAYAVGFDRRLYRSTDGGRSWTAVA